MTTEHVPTADDFMRAVADTLERLQIKPEDLFGYVMWLRSRYAECVEALHNVHDYSRDTQASELAYDVLVKVGAIKVGENEDVTSQD